MFTYNGKQNQLRMTFNRSGRTSFSVKARTEGADPSKPVSLNNDELRALRDRISTRLGDSVANTVATGVSGFAASVQTADLDGARRAAATLEEHRGRINLARGELSGAISEMEDVLANYETAAEHLDEAIDALS